MQTIRIEIDVTNKKAQNFRGWLRNYVNPGRAGIIPTTDYEVELKIKGKDCLPVWWFEKTWQLDCKQRPRFEILERE
jgi:hypothetical protein